MRPITFYLVFLLMNSSSGQAVKVKKVNSYFENQIWQSIIEIYDINGNLITETTTLTNENEMHITVQSYVYNSLNQPILDSVYFISKVGIKTLKHRTAYSYSKNNQINSITVTGEAPNYRKPLILYNRRDSFLYDNLGKKYKSIDYNSEGTDSINSFTVYAYNAKGKLVSYSTYGNDSAKISKWVYYYDNNDSIKLEELYYPVNGNFQLSTSNYWKYNNFGKLKSYKTESKHKITEITKYYYFKNGLLKSTKTKEKYSGEQKIFKEYKYNSNKIVEIITKTFPYRNGKKWEGTEKISYEYY